jgi:transcriptional regulator with XRE-family HTH domain
MARGKISCTRLTPKALRENRNRLGLTPRELAKRTGIPLTWIRHLEQGQVPFKRLPAKLRDKLKVELGICSESRAMGTVRKRFETTVRRDGIVARFTADVTRLALNMAEELAGEKCH